jgi:hypothetical protein
MQKNLRSVLCFLSVSLTILLNASIAFAVPESVKIYQPQYNFSFNAYRTRDMPIAWYKTYDGYYVTRRLPDENWVYGKVTARGLEMTDILVGSVNPAALRELHPVIEKLGPVAAEGLDPVAAKELDLAIEEFYLDLRESKRRKAAAANTVQERPLNDRLGTEFDFESPEPDVVQKRSWEEIPRTTPPDEKVQFAERVYTTLKNAMSSRRDSYSEYGEPLKVRKSWLPSTLFGEVPYPGDWGENIVWTHEKRGILWWRKWHVFGISTYGSKVLGAWILDSGFGYHEQRIPMPDFWNWYDGRILLFSQFFGREPIFDDETMAVWTLNERYLFVLVPEIKGGGHSLDHFLFNPFALIRWSLGHRPTSKGLLYCLIRLSEKPDEVTLNQIVRALRSPQGPGDSYEATGLANAQAAEEIKARRADRSVP